MAIKINEQTYPPAGRLTMPKGTFLSNPSTAADGVTQGGAGMLPPTPQVNMWAGVTPGYNEQLAPNTNFNNSQNPFTNTSGKNLNPFAGYRRPDNLVGQMPPDRYIQGPRPGGFGNITMEQAVQEGVRLPNVLRTVLSMPTIQDTTNAPNTSPTNMFKSPSTNAPANSLVGSSILSAPNQISSNQLRQIMPGLTAKQLQETMASRGFTRTYVAGVGEVWVRSSEATTNAPIAGGNNRPEFVDGASLERGERVVSAGGATYYGGQEYTDADGNTVSQYAVTLPGVREDPNKVAKHGSRYKWVSTVQRDKDGNWVRVNRQVLRKVHTRSHQKKLQARREEAAATTPQQVNSAEFNQLVNLRVSFG